MESNRKEPEVVESQVEENVDTDIEGEEAEAVADSDEPAAKPKRRRSRRKKTEMAQGLSMETKEEGDEATQEEDKAEEKVSEEPKEEEVVEAKEEAPKPRRRRAPRAKKVEAPEVAAASEATPAPQAAAPTSAPVLPPVDISQLPPVEQSVHQTMEAMVRQWSTVKDISSGMVGNLEQVAKVLTEMQTSYVAAMQETSKPKYARFELINKISAGISSAALLIAFLSLALSQSARQSAVDAMALSKVQSGVFRSSTAESSTPNKQPAIAQSSQDPFSGRAKRSKNHR